MSVFNNIIDTIKSNLSNDTNLSDVKFVNLCADESVPNPILNIYTSIGISKINIEPASFSSYLGVGTSGERYGNSTEMDIEVKIYSPKSRGSRSCYTVFSNIYESLLNLNDIYNIKKISCSQVKYNSDIFSFELSCSMSLSIFVAYDTEEINISNIEVHKKTTT